MTRTPDSRTPIRRECSPQIVRTCGSRVGFPLGRQSLVKRATPGPALLGLPRRWLAHELRPTRRTELNKRICLPVLRRTHLAGPIPCHEERQVTPTTPQRSYPRHPVTL